MIVVSIEWRMLGVIVGVVEYHVALLVILIAIIVVVRAESSHILRLRGRYRSSTAAALVHDALSLLLWPGTYQTN